MFRRRVRLGGCVWGLVVCCLAAACDSPVPREQLDDAGADPELAHASLSPTLLSGTLLNASPIIAQPVRLIFRGGFIWVVDAAQDPVLHLISAETGELLRSIGRRGQGPGEFDSPPFALGIEPADPNAVWAWDVGASRVTRLVTAPSSQAPEVVRIGGIPPVDRLTWLGDRMIGVAASDEQRFAIFDMSGERLRNVAGPLPGDPTVPLEERIKAANAAIAVCAHPAGRGFLVAYGAAGRVELYDREARFTRLADVPFVSEPVFRLDSERGEVRYRRLRNWYISCATTPERFFLLFSGRLMAAFAAEDRSSGRFVHEFDWSGGLTNVFELDRDAVSIAVDPNGSALYASSLVEARVWRFERPISDK